MKKYLAFALPFFVAGLVLMPPKTIQANVGPKKPTQIQPINLTSKAKTTALVASKEKQKSAKLSAKKKSVRDNAIAKKGRQFAKNRKGIGKVQVGRVSEMSSAAFAGTSGLDELRQHYQDWRGTRYRAGGSSRDGVDCSGFTALTFRDVYGINLPRTAREQATRGMPVNRDNLLPGDLVFFKRGQNANHVGIYLGNGKFMHASSHQGVSISSINNTYWRNKFWKGGRL